MNLSQLHRFNNKLTGQNFSGSTGSASSGTASGSLDSLDLVREAGRFLSSFAASLSL